MIYPQAIVRAKAVAEKHGPARFFAKAKGDVGELFIYDAIGGGMWSEGVTPKGVADALAEMKSAKSLNVYINSPGGDVFDGVAIYNAIRRFAGKKTVYVDGIAASAASMIAMAGDEIVMAHNATMMIHEAWGMAIGNAADMRETADLLDKITETAVLGSYARTGQTKDQLRAWMKAETWMNAEEAVQRRFADSISSATGDCGCDCADCVEGDCADCTDQCEACKADGCKGCMAMGAKSKAAALLSAYANAPERIRAKRRVTAGGQIVSQIEMAMRRLASSPAAGSQRAPGGPGSTKANEK